ncbi:MAG: BrnT family toxin [Firmicutes bacterium]|nr:BrnT family toxin [Bacillota bacterium]
MKFEWDDNKEQINIRKHGIDFSTAAYVFDDFYHIEIFDEAHSESEDRFIAIGMVDDIAVIIAVIYTERGEIIRIISARKATRREKEVYYDSSKRY